MSKRIVVCVRTLNEEKNIGRFCEAYAWADRVLVSDGGSEDDTRRIAQTFPNVLLFDFEEWVLSPGGERWYNPEPRHCNQLIRLAIAEDADWIVFDDADCVPNRALITAARGILEGCPSSQVFLNRLYVWGSDQYFPKYNVSTSLWAWDPATVDVYWPETSNTNFETTISGLFPEQGAHLPAPPFCCLHYYAPDPETVEAKLRRYSDWGHPQVHPLESIYAPPQPLPDWAK